MIPSAGRALWAGTSSVRATLKRWKAKKASKLHVAVCKVNICPPFNRVIFTPTEHLPDGCLSLGSEPVQNFSGP